MSDISLRMKEMKGVKDEDMGWHKKRVSPGVGMLVRANTAHSLTTNLEMPYFLKLTFNNFKK